MFHGAAYIYDKYIRKYVKIGGLVGSHYTEEQRKVLQMMSLDARKSVEQYVDKNGWDAVERAIRAVSNNNYLIKLSLAAYACMCMQLC